MIYDSLENLSLYEMTVPQLSAAVAMMEDPDLDLENGTHTTPVKGLRYNVVEFETSMEDREFEIHKKEIDVQIVLSGEEIIQSASPSLSAKAGLFDDEKDIAMVQGDADVTLRLSANHFALFFPGEPHKPGLASGEKCLVKKLVFKIEF